MKFMISIFLVFTLVIPSTAQSVGRYLFAGVSTYDEIEEFSSVKKGIGLRVGGGIKFNSRIGIELIFDNTPALDPPRAGELLADQIDILNSTYGRFDAEIGIETTRNLYISSVGTYTIPVNDKRSWLIKSGISYSYFKTSLRPGFLEPLTYKDNDLGLYFSGGLAIQWNRNRSAEFSITHVTGDAKATSAHFVLKHHF